MHLSRRALIAAATATILLGGASAEAAVLEGSPIGSNGTIHGCYTTAGTNGSHALTLQDSGTSCPSATTAIKWDERGRPGPAGPSTAGPSGLNVITVEGTLAPSTGNNYVAACPPGNPYLLGGSPAPGTPAGGIAGVEPLEVTSDAPSGTRTLTLSPTLTWSWLRPGMPITIFYSPTTTPTATEGQPDVITNINSATDQISLKAATDANATANGTLVTAPVWFGNYAFCSK
jgi:hypothetical protein